MENGSDTDKIYVKGDILNEKYEILEILYDGGFSRVFKAKNRKNDVLTAVKILKSKFSKMGKEEIKILKAIKKMDPRNTHLCVKMLDNFECNGNVCIVFELLGMSLYDFMFENNFQPLPLEQVRHIAYQICYALMFLHDNGITHTDIKLENIMLVDTSNLTVTKKDNKNIKNLKCTDIKLIDMGMARFAGEDKNFVVSSRPYRAIEIILEIGWSHPIDIWSLGCVLFEIYTGKTMFEPEDNMEHLDMMKRMLGPIPCDIIREHREKRQSTVEYFTYNSPKYPLVPCKPLISQHMDGTEDSSDLINLIQRMLEYDPETRITSADALQHIFFDMLPANQQFELNED